MKLGSATVVWTSAAEGDLGSNSTPISRRAVHERGWLQLRQVHGDKVLVAESLEQTLAEADAAVTRQPGLTLAVATADCAPVALAAPEGVIAAVHAGWKGLDAGVIERTAEQMRLLGASEIVGALGPCIHADCYEFEPSLLSELADRWGPEVVASTGSGAPALDMVAAVGSVCRSVGIELIHQASECTGCDSSYFSHRARSDVGRQVMLVWRDQ